MSEGESTQRGGRRVDRARRTPSRPSAADAESTERRAGNKRSIRRFLPLALVVIVLGAGAALLHGVYASVEWGLETSDAWYGLVLAGLVAGGYAWGRWKALAFLGAIPWLALALLLDAAWLSGLWDRSEDYEPLPATPFVLVLGVPVFAGLVALGVALRTAVHPPRRERPTGR